MVVIGPPPKGSSIHLRKLSSMLIVPPKSTWQGRRKSFGIKLLTVTYQYRRASDYNNQFLSITIPAIQILMLTFGLYRFSKLKEPYLMEFFTHDSR